MVSIYRLAAPLKKRFLVSSVFGSDVMSASKVILLPAAVEKKILESRPGAVLRTENPSTHGRQISYARFK
jgi:hypothetical protein